jgi:hypothetical protein
MTLKVAKTLREEIRRTGIHCVVPLGFAPDGYFARIFTSDGPLDFYDRGTFRKYKADLIVSRRAKRRTDVRLARPRSPIDILIDRSCGLD